MKRTRKQIGSLLLSVCMVLTMLPTVAFADSTSQIISFENLVEDFALQEVDKGTRVDGLNLPRTLTATVTSGSALTVNPLTYTFDSLEEGYGYSYNFYLDKAEAKTFTMTNTGNTELTGVGFSHSNEVANWCTIVGILQPTVNGLRSGRFKAVA